MEIHIFMRARSLVHLLNNEYHILYILYNFAYYLNSPHFRTFKFLTNG